MRADRDLFLNSYYDDKNDVLGLIMKDVETLDKRHVKIERPKLDVYMYKKNPKHFLDYVLTKDCEKKKIAYKWKDSEIAGLLGIDRTTYKEQIRTDKTKMKALKLNKIIFGVDINIEDQYLMQYMDSFPKSIDDDGYDKYDDTPPIRNIHKGYLDMEWDISVSDIPSEQPIYLITYTDGFHNVSYTYYLYNPNYKYIDLLENDKESFIKNMKDRINEHIKIENLNLKPDVAAKVQPILQKTADKMEYIIKRYDDEETMIKDIYQLAFRTYKPDFLLIYNARADIGQAMLRYEQFGADCVDLFTCPDVGTYYNMDMSDQRFEPNERNDVFDCASYTKVICSYQQYYTLRRTERYANRGLGDTALREIGVSKLSFNHICNSIADLPSTDFLIATEYNIRDVILMVFLENCLNDVEYMMSLRFLKTVDYNRVFIPSIGVFNTMYHISLRNGKIMGNNVNKIINSLTDDELLYFQKRDPIVYKLAMQLKAKKKIEGGLCSDPTKFVGASRKEMMSFMKSLVLKHVIDMDAKSEYPNAIISGMMAKSTLLGRIKSIDGEDISYRDVYTYTQAMINRDYVAICREFFNLPSVSEVLTEVGYKIPKLKKRSNLNKALNIDVMFNKTNFNSLNNIMSKMLNPKQDKKDTDIGEIAMRGVYIVNREIDNEFKYFGSRVKYKIIEKDSLADISIMDYVGYTGNEDILAINAVDKEIDNSIIDDIRVESKNPNEILSKRLEFIGSLNITDSIIDFTNPKKLRKVNIDYAGTRLSIPSRFITFPTAKITKNWCKQVKNLSSMFKGTQYITKESIINISFTDISGMYIKDNPNVILVEDVYKIVPVEDSFKITIVNSKGKEKDYYFEVVNVNYNLYQVKDIVEDNIYKGEISYSISIDDAHSLIMKQEFYFVNYISYKEE